MSISAPAATLKGFRDFMPETARKRTYLVSRIREVFERAGFDPIETPALEYLETFQGNIGEDEKLFFKFKDQGGRDVAMRYDQTVPTARFVAQYANTLVFPFKRYQIQTVWRAEKPQKGRYREFLQCDADIFGVITPEADAEVIALSIEIYRALGFKDFTLRINDRSAFQDVPYEVIVAVDKLKKIGTSGVVKEIESKGFSKSQAETFIQKITTSAPTSTIERIFSYLKDLQIPDNLYVFDPTIARSFNYSTGPIWEVVIAGYVGGSVLGGERYDNLIGKFQQQSIPATGFAVGFDRTYEAMEQYNLFPTLSSTTKVLVTIFSPAQMPLSLLTASRLRKSGVNTDIYSDPSVKLDKQLKYTDKKQIPYALIIGPEEAEKGVVLLKDMRARTQLTSKLEDVIKLLQI